MIEMIKKFLILSLIFTTGTILVALSISIIPKDELSLKSFIGLFGLLFFGISTVADAWHYKVALFKAFQAQDFRTCSCGGCI